MRYFLLTLLLLTSCAGYKFQDKSNPFAQYGIKSLYVPMFYNHGNLGNVNSKLTEEIMQTLLEFKDLKLKQDINTADAVLLGIVTTKEKRKDTIQTISRKSVENIYEEEAFGIKSTREDFYVPSVNRIRFDLRVIVIKHPTKEEIKFLQTELGEKFLSSKVIFNERIRLSEDYALKELSETSIDVIGTQNRGVEKQTFDTMAKEAASSFKEMILYAF